MSFRINIAQAAAENQNFRAVLHTTEKSQLVVMCIPPGGEIGTETHHKTEQNLFFVSGTGESILNGKVSPLAPGDVLIVTPGVEHNIRNTGAGDLKLYTVYVPPNHIDGRIHHTKADADADAEDEAVGG